MSETNEQLIMRMGFDGREAQRGMDAMLASNREAAAKTKAIWAEADRSMQAARLREFEQEEAENAARVAAEKEVQIALLAADIDGASRRNKARALYRERDAAAAAAQAKINAEIEAGSGGFGFVPGAAAGAGLRSEIEGVGGASGHAAGNVRVMSRELMVIVRELTRGNFGRVFGSVTILLNSMGGAMQKLMSSVFGPFGIALGAIGIAAYALYEDIKNFNKLLDDTAAENAKSISDSTKAIKDATAEGIKSAAELEAHIRGLADAHESLAHWAEVSAELLEKNAAAQEKLINATSNRRMAAINLAEHMGMVSGADASAMRSQLTVDNFRAIQTAKLGALNQEGNTLLDARAEAQRRQVDLEAQARAAQAAVTGVDENGHVVNQTAFARNQQMRERQNLQEDIKRRQEKVAQAEGGSDLENWVGNALDPLAKSKAALIEGEKGIIAREIALLKSSEDQNKKNIDAQVGAEASYKEITKNLDENAESLKSLSDDLTKFKEKYKDAGAAMSELRQSLIQKGYENQSRQILQDESENRVTPSIDMLAGRSRISRLDRAYGKGGRYDLERGDGPFANAAYNVELNKKREMWDIVHGNALFDAQGNLIGGAAQMDRKIATANENLLRGAGLQTPEMRMAELIQNGKDIQGELQALNTLMSNSGILINTDS